MSAAPYLEIVELPSGEVILRRSDSTDGPSRALVTISFSEEAREHLGAYLGDVGRGMIGAGMQIVSQLQAAENPYPDGERSTLH
jgi:hypothetical protein